MQLKKIKSKLTLASCTLLQIAAPATAAATSEWDVDTAFLYYSESDGRVQAAEPAIYVSHKINDDETINLRLVVDVLTGATPNGAHASSVAQTFTSPSGEGSYTTEAGKTPLDSTFHDTRAALAADWTTSIDRLSKITLGFNASAEFDYVSLGLSSNYARDFNNRNTTLNAGIGFNFDQSSPVGGLPIELAPMTDQNSAQNRQGSTDSKTLTDVLFGVTQVINRKTIMQLNYSLGQTSGYQNDPYKIVSVIDPGTGLPPTVTESVFFNSAGNLPYVYEKRPDSRLRNSLFFKTVRHLTEDVINFSYRYYWDDWGINSHTLDLKYRYQLSGSYLQPHLRYYTQQSADFYAHDLKLGTDVDATTGVVSSQYVSSDYRLASFDSSTIGLKYGLPLGDGSEFSVRGELMNQSVNDEGVPAGEETPDLNALVLQFNYSLLW